MVRLKVLGLLYCAHATLPHLRRAAVDGPRHVADMVNNISSLAGRHARNGNGVYALTKFGVGAFSESLRQELAGSTCGCRWSSQAPRRPNWPAITGPKSWKASVASWASEWKPKTSPMPSATSSPARGTSPSTRCSSVPPNNNANPNRNRNPAPGQSQGPCDRVVANDVQQTSRWTRASKPTGS